MDLLIQRARIRRRSRHSRRPIVDRLLKASGRAARARVALREIPISHAHVGRWDLGIPMDRGIRTARGIRTVH